MTAGIGRSTLTRGGVMRRRMFLQAVTAAWLRPDSISRVHAATAGETRAAETIARDEDFWREIQQAFTLDRNLINLNNGGVSPSPKVVQEAMRRYLEFSNIAPAHTMWRILEPEVESVRQRLAASFGCDPEELAITRNTSEALEICQLGLDLKRGDEVLTTDHDYPRMITTWQQRERRDGVVLKTISFPVPPPSLDDLARRFEQAITPRTRVIHFCHITNLTGQIFPVRQICQMARSRGIRRSLMAPMRSRSSPSAAKIWTAITMAPVCTSGCWRRTARDFFTSGARTSGSCGPSWRRLPLWTGTSANSRKSARILPPTITPSLRRSLFTKA